MLRTLFRSLLTTTCPFLLFFGAQDPHLANTKGKTAATLAEAKGHQALHDLLLQFMRVM